MSRSVEDSSNKLVISSATRSAVSSSGSYAKSIVRRLLHWGITSVTLCLNTQLCTKAQLQQERLAEL